MSEKLACVKCGAPIERRPGRGRPPLYCGDVCRSAAAYEIRRLQRRLEGLEARLSWLRHDPGESHLNAYQRKYARKRRAEQLAGVETEIAEAEARMRLLLSEPRGKILEDAS